MTTDSKKAQPPLPGKKSQTDLSQENGVHLAGFPPLPPFWEDVPRLLFSDDAFTRAFATELTGLIHASEVPPHRDTSSATAAPPAQRIDNSAWISEVDYVASQCLARGEQAGVQAAALCSCQQYTATGAGPREDVNSHPASSHHADTDSFAGGLRPVSSQPVRDVLVSAAAAKLSAELFCGSLVRSIVERSADRYAEQDFRHLENGYTAFAVWDELRESVVTSFLPQDTVQRDPSRVTDSHGTAEDGRGLTISFSAEGTNALADPLTDFSEAGTLAYTPRLCGTRAGLPYLETYEERIAACSSRVPLRGVRRTSAGAWAAEGTTLRTAAATVGQPPARVPVDEHCRYVLAAGTLEAAPPAPAAATPAATAVAQASHRARRAPPASPQNERGTVASSSPGAAARTRGSSTSPARVASGVAARPSAPVRKSVSGPAQTGKDAKKVRLSAGVARDAADAGPVDSHAVGEFDALTTALGLPVDHTTGKRTSTVGAEHTAAPPKVLSVSTSASAASARGTAGLVSIDGRQARVLGNVVAESARNFRDTVGGRRTVRETEKAETPTPREVAPSPPAATRSTVTAVSRLRHAVRDATTTQRRTTKGVPSDSESPFVATRAPQVADHDPPSDDAVTALGPAVGVPAAAGVVVMEGCAPAEALSVAKRAGPRHRGGAPPTLSDGGPFTVPAGRQTWAEVPRRRAGAGAAKQRGQWARPRDSSGDHATPEHAADGLPALPFASTR